MVARFQVDFTEHRRAVQIVNDLFNGGRDMACALYRLVCVAHIHAESDFVRSFRFRYCDDSRHPLCGLRADFFNDVLLLKLVELVFYLFSEMKGDAGVFAGHGRYFVISVNFNFKVLQFSNSLRYAGILVDDGGRAVAHLVHRYFQDT